MKTKRVGRKMAQVVNYVRRNGGIATVIDVAAYVGPHNSLYYGYAIVSRAIRAGLVTYAAPLPGRRGMSIIIV